VFWLCEGAANQSRANVDPRGSNLTVEIESILVNEELAALLEAAETSGQLRQVELNELLEPLELDPLETDAVYQELDRRGIELVVEEEKEEAPRRRARCSAGGDDDRRAPALPP